MAIRRPALASLVTLAIAAAMTAAACGSSASTPTSADTQAAPTPAAGSPAASDQPATAEVSVSIVDMTFSPATITVKPGTKVTWTNQDSIVHTTTADDRSWDSGSLAKGQSFSRTFDAAGTYTYHCTPHPSMKGTIVVAP